MEGPELLDILGKNGVNIVCHGHRHHPRVKNIIENGWTNPITFISSGSLSVCVKHRGEDIPNTFHIIELSEEQSFYLRSYQFKSIDGWLRIQENNNYTPLDFEMYFKEPVETSIIKNHISNLCSFNKGENRKELCNWKELSSPLKSLTLSDLNKTISDYCIDNGIKSFGEFPNKVALIKL